MARARTPPPDEPPAEQPPRRRRSARETVEEETTVIAQPAVASGPLFQISPWAAAVGAALVASMAALGLAIAAFVTRGDGRDELRLPAVRAFRDVAPGELAPIPRFRALPGPRGDLLPRPNRR